MQEIDKPSQRQYYYLKNQDGVLIDAGVIETDRCIAVPDNYTLYYTPDKIQYNQEMSTVLDVAPYTFNEIPTPVFEVTGELLQFDWGEGFDLNEVFYIYASPSVAVALSEALYKLIYPNQDGYYAYVINSNNIQEQPMSILEFKKRDTIPISLGADPAPLADALAITVADGALTQEEVDNIVAAVSAHAGQEVNLIDFIPPSWQNMVITIKEAMRYYNVPRIKSI